MLGIGRPAVEAKYSLKLIATCKTGDRCFVVDDPLLAIVGTEASVFAGRIGAYPLGSLGCNALVFMSHDSAGWHYVNSGCVQNTGFLPGKEDHVFVPTGCANVRTAPSLSASVVACLAANTLVEVDSAPVYADSHIWWHLAGRGWMAHDFLVAPNI
ncbi:MAG TPA: SH3 domain-containing protein [Candidatus Dormibacteraeota bacterium]|nr:SH3 domain-containing protein [Candidatus Dormibacteraeota bacterium]